MLQNYLKIYVQISILHLHFLNILVCNVCNNASYFKNMVLRLLKNVLKSSFAIRVIKYQLLILLFPQNNFLLFLKWVLFLRRDRI